LTDYESHLQADFGRYPLGEIVGRTAERVGGRIAMRAWTGESYREIAYPDLAGRIEAVAKWLVDYGIKPGDRVAVLGENRPEWGMAYLGIVAAGGTVVPVDALMPLPGIRHILVDSEARLLFATSRFLKDMAETEELPSLEHRILIGGEPVDGAIGFNEILSAGSESSAVLPEVSLSDRAAILYTSGTTGHSKGVVLTHNNIASNIAACCRVFPLGSDDTFLSVLPIHHAFESTAGFLLPLYIGCSITYARSLKSADIVADIKNTGVTLMVGVPLLYEKMHEGIVRNIKKKGWATRQVVGLLTTVSAIGDKVGLELGALLFRSLREKAGLGTVRFFISGGGPLNPATALFFHRLGLRLLQGYGLTETSPVSHVNPPWDARFETVGPPIPGVEHRILEPNAQGIGEVLLRGENIFLGYYRSDEATQEVMTPDGWFRTGDLGKIHPDGHLQIMGRKKNMIVTGGGKNVYPEEVEHYLNASRFIAESLVLGAPRSSGYGEDVVALIHPEYEQIDLHFEELGRGKPTDADVEALLKEELRQTQASLADYKRVRRYRILEEEFQKTSTRKIKRFLYKGTMVDVDSSSRTK